MSISLDDPRLTAYVLGELEENDRIEIEEAIAADGELAVAVEKIQEVTGGLGQALAEVPDAGMEPEQRRVVMDRVQEAKAKNASGGAPVWRLLPYGLLVAAALMIWAISVPSLHESRSHADRSRLERESMLANEQHPRQIAEKPDSKIDGSQPVVEPQIVDLDLSTALDLPVEEHNVDLGLPATECKYPEAPIGCGVNSKSIKDDPRREPIGVSPSIEQYDHIVENGFVSTKIKGGDASTFSIDVDTASYANARRFLTQGSLPPKGAVRIEELVNYFRYNYTAPSSSSADPFAANVEIASCPWNERHRLARIALKGREMPKTERPASNLVFLIDVSGSMSSANKLGLLKQAFKMLVNQLDSRDRVAMVVYAGNSGLVLDATPGDERQTIIGALDRLRAGGSTNGGAGIQLAYSVATKNFIKGGCNRVILATDGDFNVGVRDRSGLISLVEEKAKSGVFLSILGFGMGNYKDGQMEQISNKGNGNYAYIDTVKEARKVLVEQMAGTLVTIAKDVKIQIFFNPARVAGWRLIGYENRLLRREDFNDDSKDAGEIGAGHCVTALYELVPAGVPVPTTGSADPNPFTTQKTESQVITDSTFSFRLRLRYKQPDGDTSKLLEWDVKDHGGQYQNSTADFRWAAAVAGFGMMLRESRYRNDLDWGQVLDLAVPAAGNDPHGFRGEFVELCQQARKLQEQMRKR